MTGNSTVFSLTLAATATGSVAVSVDADPYYSIQLYRTTGSQTVEFSTLSYSNLSVGDVPGAYADHPGAFATSPLSSSLPKYAGYWAADPTFTGSTFTVAAAPGSGSSLVYNCGNIGTVHTKFQFGTKTGGTFLVALNRKP